MSDTVEKMDHIVNGVNAHRIIELATNMAQDTNYAQFRFRAVNQWLHGSRSRTSIKNFYAGNNERSERPQALTVDCDQPVFLAGENTAPNAVEHYLNALVSCIETTIIAHASVQNIPVKSLTVSAEGQMDARGFFGVSEDVLRGYSFIKVDISCKTLADEKTLRKLMSYSPVCEMVSKAVQVEVNFTINT